MLVFSQCFWIGAGLLCPMAWVQGVAEEIGMSSCQCDCLGSGHVEERASCPRGCWAFVLSSQRQSGPFPCSAFV